MTFHINERVILTTGHKKGRKGIVVETPYDGDDEENRIGVLWDDNKMLGVVPVDPSNLILFDEWS